MATEIYDRVIAVAARKKPGGHRCDAECKKYDHRYVHFFKSKAPLYGEADGTLRIGRPAGRPNPPADGALLRGDTEKIIAVLAIVWFVWPRTWTTVDIDYGPPLDELDNGFGY